MKKILKPLFVVFFCGAALYTLLTFIFDPQYYTKEDLIDNYKKRTKEISELVTFIKTTVPPGKTIEIEFDGNRRLSKFYIENNGAGDIESFIKINSPRVDILLYKLGWTRETLSALKEKLNDANCISIKSGEPCKIGFQRSGMGKYYYNVFDTAIPIALQSRYNDSCTYILYNDKLVLEYGGGAAGAQCF